VELPVELRLRVEALLEGKKVNELRKIAETLSDRYRNESGAGKKLLTKEIEAAVYAEVRMPATYGAVYSACDYMLEHFEGKISTVLDAGAGSGAASFAIADLIDVEKITCLEREGAMRSVGEKLMKGNLPAVWKSMDLTGTALKDKADLVVESYVLNEMTEEHRENVIRNLWNAANEVLLLVEPGTPAGYSVLKKARTILLEQGGHIMAPCTHESPCRLAEDDWCHFTVRVARSKMHKMLKDADVPYEDEKYAFLAVSKKPCSKSELRILRHPFIEKGLVRLEVCTAEENKTLVVKKKDGELYKKARKAKMGDSL